MKKHSKTWKRELAVLMVVWLGFLSSGAEPNVELIEVLVWPIALFTGAAFSMEWAGGQGAKIFTNKLNSSIN